MLSEVGGRFAPMAVAQAKLAISRKRPQTKISLSPSWVESVSRAGRGSTTLFICAAGTLGAARTDADLASMRFIARILFLGLPSPAPAAI